MRPRRGSVALNAAAVAMSVAIGIAAGLGGYTFVYARGGSYMSDDPAACANCHVMGEVVAAWGHSSHRNVATCNDCHTPEGLPGKLLTKASNGWHHSLAFTAGEFPETIQIKPANRAIAEGACRKCHGDVVHAIETGTDADAPLSCTRCHGGVGHPSGLTPESPDNLGGF